MVTDNRLDRRPNAWRDRAALIYYLGRQQLERRYSQSLLGVLWSAINPMAQVVVFLIVFTQIFSTPIDRYFIFLVAGVLPWNFLSACFNAGTQSLIQRKQNIEGSILPLSALVLGDVAAEFMIFAMYFVPIVVVVAVLSKSIGVAALALPIVLAPVVITAAAGALVLAHLTARVRDVAYLVQIFMPMLFWFLPLAYKTSQAPPWLESIVRHNPLALMIVPVQTLLHEGIVPDVGALAVSFAAALAATGLASVVHQYLKRHTVLYL